MATFARWGSVFFSFSVLTFLFSLAAAQIFLALAMTAYVIHLWRDRPAVHFPPVKVPLALFCLLTVLSVVYARNPGAGGFAIRKLVLFAILLLAANLVVTARHLRLLWLGLFCESALAGALGIGQFVAIYRRLLEARPDRVYASLTVERADGFLGHWMNFGGQQMLVFAVLLAFLLFARRVRGHWWIPLAIVAVSIALSFTRGVWLGCAAAVVYLVGCWRPRWVWLLPGLLLLGYLAAPSPLRQRLLVLEAPKADPSIAIRFEMWEVGLNMMRVHPWLGVGPGNIPEAYVAYLPSGKVPIVGYHEHLHNNLLQIGAERGLPCLGAWLWLMGGLAWYNWKRRRRLGQQAWASAAALGGWLAFFLEGLSEFNFGTSPVMMLFLFVMCAASAEGRPEGGERGPAAPVASVPVSASA